MPQYGACWRGLEAFLIGDVAQMGERLVRNEEVGGSIPLISTNSFWRSEFRVSDPSKSLGRARRGASGALDPQSAIAELNPHPRPSSRCAGQVPAGVEGQVRRNRGL